MDEQKEVKQSPSLPPDLPVLELEVPAMAPGQELPKQLPTKAKAVSPRESPRPPAADPRSIRPARVPMPTPSKPKAGSAEAIVEQWFRAHFHNALWTGNSLIYNKLHEAKKDLIIRLRKED